MMSPQAIYVVVLIASIILLCAAIVERDCEKECVEIAEACSNDANETATKGETSRSQADAEMEACWYWKPTCLKRCANSIEHALRKERRVGAGHIKE